MLSLDNFTNVCYNGVNEGEVHANYEILLRKEVSFPMTKILRNGRCEDVTEAGALGMLSRLPVPLAVLATVIYQLISLVLHGTQPRGAGDIIPTALATLAIWLCLLSACHFGWYALKHDRRYYLADLPEFYLKNRSPWLALSLFAGMPFLLVSWFFLEQVRFMRRREDGAAERSLWKEMETYIGPAFETKAELEEFTAQQREGFVQFCQEAQQNCGRTTVVKTITKPTGAKATKVKIQPIDEPEKFVAEAVEMFDFLMEQKDIIQIRTSPPREGHKMRSLEVFVRARPYSSKTRETYDAGDYYVILHGREAFVRVLRSGMSANGKAQSPQLDESQRYKFAFYINNQIDATLNAEYNRKYSTSNWLGDAPQLGDVLTMILHIVSAFNRPELLCMREDELPYYYRKSVDCYYDTVTSGLKFYVARDR